ncbi:MAG: DNA-deoxyinosine glycosylase [Oscillospiraceae bacterium]
MGEYRHIVHGFEPVFDENSRVLVLGSLPSVKSRENNFYYGNPQNRFWKVIAVITKNPVPQSIEEKKRLLLENRIAVWDVISECDIIGSSDASIKNVVPADLSRVLDFCPIEKIFANGAAAARFYNRFIEKKLGRQIITLPSTSPANAAWSFDRLLSQWSQILL